MNLQHLGWNHCAYPFPPNQSHARVARASRDHFLVWTHSGELETTLTGALRYTETDHPCVGDWVTLRGDHLIDAILPRHTQFARKQPGHQNRPQVLAANLDVLFILMGLDHDYNPNRLERYLILAYESGARPVILLNKADLHPDPESILQETRRHARGVPVLALSALSRQNLEPLADHLHLSETAALIGSSGTGKSTLINSLLGESRQQTHQVRDADSKGRHTTTHRELILMPPGTLLEGRLLMDLPGLRELQLWASPEQLDQTFSEISELAAQCRFRDCTHRHEPGCAVRDGDLPEGRLASYQKLQRELAHLDKETNREAARAYRQKTKAIEKEIRHHIKRTFYLR